MTHMPNDPLVPEEDELRRRLSRRRRLMLLRRRHPNPTTSAPANTVAPAVTGTATFGSTLTTTDGTWTGAATITYTYQWQRAGVNISGATASTYVLRWNDGGTNVRCVVTGTNGVGNASANSNAAAVSAVTGLSATFETGVDAATIDIADAGSASAWNVRNMAVGGMCTYSSTNKYGTLSGKFGKAAATNLCNMGWTTSLGTITEHWGRTYLWIDAYDATRLVFANFQVYAVSNCARLDIKSDGNFAVYNAVGTQVLVSSAVHPLSQWVRYEWHIIHSETVGFAEVKIFNSPDSATVTETLTSGSNLNLGANITGSLFGNTVAVTAGMISWQDNIVMNATGYPGPA